MSSLRTSEIFTSIEGEGPYTGQPTLFVRLYGCNFECRGFANPSMEKLDYSMYTPLKSIAQVTKLERGCDSAYSWSKESVHLSKKWDSLHSLAAAILEERDNRGDPGILSLTGGEPTLHQKGLVGLLPLLNGEFDTLLIETNTSLEYTPEFLKALEGWVAHGGKVTFSNSPKLSLSGETREKAWVPKVVFQQLTFLSNLAEDFLSHVYFKFVVDGSNEALAEIEEYMKMYDDYVMEHQKMHTWLGPRQIWLMPVGDTEPQLKMIAKRVAEQAIGNGYNYCGRLHVYIWDDEVGR